MDVWALRDRVLSGTLLRTPLRAGAGAEGGTCVTRCCWNRSDSSRESLRDVIVENTDGVAKTDIENPVDIPAKKEKDEKQDMNPEDLAIEQRWRDLVEQGELDVYTCLSLRNSCESHEGRKHEIDWDTIKTAGVLVAMQVVVPGLMLLHQWRHMPAFALDRQSEFRIVGFVLFLYSVRNMHGNALSECRELYLHKAYYALPLKYVWPAILGELVNSWCAFILCVTLYTVFCGTAKLPELLINCISINFIGNVDEEFVSEDLKLKAGDNFHKNMQIIRNAKAIDPKSCGHSRQILNGILYGLRVGGTLGLGTLLAFVFLLSHEPFLCNNLGFLANVGLC